MRLLQVQSWRALRAPSAPHLGSPLMPRLRPARHLARAAGCFRWLMGRAPRGSRQSGAGRCATGAPPTWRRPEGAGARRSASHSVTGLGLSLCPLAMVVGARRPGAPDGYALAQTPSQPSRPVGMGGAGARQRAGPAAPSPSSRLVAASHPKRRRREASCHTVKTQCVRGPCTPWAARRLAVRNAVPLWPRDRSRGACASARPRGAAATTTSPCSGSPSVRAAR